MKEIGDIVFERSDDNITDALRKKMNQRALMEVVRSGILLVKLEQRIIRN